MVGRAERLEGLHERAVGIDRHAVERDAGTADLAVRERDEVGHRGILAGEPRRRVHVLGVDRIVAGVGLDPRRRHEHLVA